MRSRDDYDYLINFIVSFPCKLYTQHIYTYITHFLNSRINDFNLSLSQKKEKKKKGDETCYSNSRSNLRKTKRLDQLVLIERKS